MTYYGLFCDCGNIQYKNSQTEPDCEECNTCYECCNCDDDKEC